MKRKTGKKLIVAALILTMLASCVTGCGKKVYRSVVVDAMNGVSSVERGKDTIEAYVDMKLQAKDTVTVDSDSNITLLLDADKHIAAEANTVFSVDATGTEENGAVEINLVKGAALFSIDNKLNENSTFEVITPNSTLSVRGTVFWASYDPETNITSLRVDEGLVAVVNTETKDTDEVPAGEAVNVTDDGIVEAPKPVGNWMLMYDAGEVSFDDNGFVTKIDQFFYETTIENDGKKYTSFSSKAKPDFEGFEYVDEGYFDEAGNLAYRHHGSYDGLKDTFSYEFDSEGRVSKMIIDTKPDFPTSSDKFIFTEEYNYSGNIVTMVESYEEYEGSTLIASYRNDTALRSEYDDNGKLLNCSINEDYHGPDRKVIDMSFAYDGDTAKSVTLEFYYVYDWSGESVLVTSGTFNLPENPKSGDHIWIANGGELTTSLDYATLGFVYAEDTAKAFIPSNYPSTVYNW